MKLYQKLELALIIGLVVLILFALAAQAAPTPASEPYTVSETQPMKTLYQPKKKLEHWQIAYEHSRYNVSTCYAERGFKDGARIKASAYIDSNGAPYISNVILYNVDFEFQGSRDRTTALLQIDDGDVYEVGVDQVHHVDESAPKHAVTFSPPDDAKFLQQFVKGRKLQVIINNLSYTVDLTESLAAHKALLECAREASGLLRKQIVADAKPASIKR